MKRVILTGICSLLLVMMVYIMPVYAQEEGQILSNEGTVETDEILKGEESSEEEEPSEGEEPSEEDKLQISELKDLRLTLVGGTSYTYTGKAISPKVSKIVFKDKVGKTIETTEVKIEKYVNNVKIGTADIVISIEGYEGTATIKSAFKIVFGNVSSIKTTPAAYNKIKLSWGKVAGADGYVIYRSTKSTSGFKGLKTISKGSTVTHDDTSVKIGTTYYYKMRAYRLVNGKKVYSAYTKVVKQKAQVATVKISSAKRAAYNAIKIQWGKASGASGYVVYRSNSEKGTYKKIATVKGGSKVTYTDKKCSCGVTYYYKVAAYRTSNKKNYYGSNSAFASANTTPDKTAFTSSTMSGNTEAVLCWEKTSGATGYTIYRSIKKDSGYKAVKHITKAKTVKWTDTGLKADQVYYYKVRPYVLVKGQKVYGTCPAIFKKELYSKKMASIQKYTYVQYRSGGTTTSGWDCSGFTKWAMKYLYGIEIGRNSSAQAKGGKAVSKTNRSAWKPGDILVYSSGGRVNHVALYIGNNKIMHALNTKYDTVIHDVDYYEKWDKKNNLKCVRRYF